MISPSKKVVSIGYSYINRRISQHHLDKDKNAIVKGGPKYQVVLKGKIIFPQVLLKSEIIIGGAVTFQRTKEVHSKGETLLLSVHVS